MTRSHNIRQLIFLTAILLVLGKSSVLGLNDNCGMISGKIYIKHPGNVYIYLVDEDSSKNPLSGKLLQKNADQTDVDTGYIEFVFSKLKQGVYGIRSFQDLNNNKKLDRGAFSPSEPWGFSWNKPNPSKFPLFTDYCHKSNNDIINIEIYLNK